MSQRTPIVITGYGILSSLGSNSEATRARLFSESVTPLAPTDSQDKGYRKLLDSQWEGRCSLDPDFFQPSLFALLTIDEALAMAGLRPTDLANQRVGVCIGSTAGCTNYNEKFAADFYHDKLPTTEKLSTYFQTNTSQFVSRHYGFRGPTMMVNNACTSGADTIGIGASWINSGVCDIVICGGTELVIPLMYYGFRSLMLCSPESCRPFDKNRQGLVLGEGAGIVILEKATTQRPHRAHVLGYGSGSDAYHPTSPHPLARGLGLAAEVACNQAGIQFGQIDFINAHATGTPHNDLTEGKWIFENMPQAQVVGTKGFTGHTLGAAGAIEAILTVMSLEQQRLPATEGFAEADPEIKITPTLAIETGKFNTAISFSLGFGGTNAALCLGVAT